jgi:tetratricopeptide (TPR) repeat protein
MDDNQRREIDNLLRQSKLRTTSGDEKYETGQRDVALEEYNEALRLVNGVIDRLTAVFRDVQGERGALPEELTRERNEIAKLLADCYGRRGGILRRKGDRQQALESYHQGRVLEQDPQYRIVDSYNLTNAVLLPLLIEPGSVGRRQEEVRQTAETVEKQIRSKRGDQWWAWADLGLLSLLSHNPARAREAYAKFADTGARPMDYRSTIKVLKEYQEELAAVSPDVTAAIEDAILFLKKSGLG